MGNLANKSQKGHKRSRFVDNQLLERQSYVVDRLYGENVLVLKNKLFEEQACLKTRIIKD